MSPFGIVLFAFFGYVVMDVIIMVYKKEQGGGQ